MYIYMSAICNFFGPLLKFFKIQKLKHLNSEMKRKHHNSISSPILPISCPLPSHETEKPKYAHFHKTTVDYDIGAPERG